MVFCKLYLATDGDRNFWFVMFAGIASVGSWYTWHWESDEQGVSTRELVFLGLGSLVVLALCVIGACVSLGISILDLPQVSMGSLLFDSSLINAFLRRCIQISAALFLFAIASLLRNSVIWFIE